MTRRPQSPTNKPGPLEDHNFFRQRVFRHLHLPHRPALQRWTWVRIWALATAAGMSVALYQVQTNADRDNQRTLDGAYVNCLTGNEVRTAMQDVVRRAYATGATTLDFTKIPGFDDLAAPEQRYFENLQAIIAAAPDPADDPNSRLNVALALLALRDCEAEFPTHSPGITLPPRAPLQGQ